MNSYRKIGVTVGVLFILATAVGLAGAALLGSTLKDSDLLSAVALRGNGLILSALLSLIAAFTSAGIAIALYPVLRPYSQGLALGSVGFRLIEAVFYTIGTLCLLALFALSQQSAGASGQAIDNAKMLGHLLVAAKDLSGFVLGVLAFCLGGGMYYAVFYRTQLIPRWLSAWGLIALIMLAAAVLTTLFDGEPYSVSGGLVYLAFPIAVQEMVLAVWLIAKGFNPSALEALAPNAGAART